MKTLFSFPTRVLLGALLALQLASTVLRVDLFPGCTYNMYTAALDRIITVPWTTHAFEAPTAADFRWSALSAPLRADVNPQKLIPYFDRWRTVAEFARMYQRCNALVPPGRRPAPPAPAYVNELTADDLCGGLCSRFDPHAVGAGVTIWRVTLERDPARLDPRLRGVEPLFRCGLRPPRGVGGAP